MKILGTHSSHPRTDADSPPVPRGITVPVGQPRGRQQPEYFESRNGSTGLSQRSSWIKPRGDQALAEWDSKPRMIHKQRRCGSMKRMLFLGVLALSATVCSQSYGFELLDRMLGHHGSCDSCCEPACDAGCCEPGCDAAGCCEPACDAGMACCEPACDAGNGCCEPACDAGCTSCCDRPCGKKHNLFGGLKSLFAKCKAKHNSCCDDSCCEPACDAGNGCCEPACDAGNGCCEPGCDANGCCEPACDAGVACCEPACDAGCTSCCDTGCKKEHRLLGLFKAIHSAKKRCHSCTDSCCEPACDAGNGCCEPGCDAGSCCEPACGAANMAPVPDASASNGVSGGVFAAFAR